jgi:hypothetical protein
VAQRVTSLWAAPPVVIDLGLVGAGPSGVDEEVRRYRPPPWFAALVVAVLAVGGLTASGSRRPAAGAAFAVEHVSGPIRLTGDTLYTMVGGGRDVMLNAYRLDSGSLWWQYRPAARAVVWTEQPSTDVVLLAPAACVSLDTFQTVGVDARTGRFRWRVAGTPVLTVSGSGLVLVKRPVDGCAETGLGVDPSPSASFVWSAVDVASGAVVWSLAVAGGSTLSVGHDESGAGRWLAVEAFGSITVYDLATGKVSAVLPLAEPARVRLLAAGSQALLLRRVRGVFSMTSYDAAHLSPQWTIEIPRPVTIGLADLGVFTSTECGPVVCLGSLAHTTGLDPRTGAQQWRVNGHLVRAGAATGIFRRPVPTGGQPELVVHDLTTGAQRLVLSGWDLVGAGAARRTEAAVVVASTTGRQTWVWSVDLSGGRLRPIGAVPRQELSQCAALARYLACESRDGNLRAWRLARVLAWPTSS